MKFGLSQASACKSATKKHAECLAWELSRCREGDSRGTAGIDLKDLGVPHVTKMRKLADNKLTFPLKQIINGSIETWKIQASRPKRNTTRLRCHMKTAPRGDIVLGEQYLVYDGVGPGADWRHAPRGEEMPEGPAAPEERTLLPTLMRCHVLVPVFQAMVECVARTSARGSKPMQLVVGTWSTNWALGLAPRRRTSLQGSERKNGGASRAS